MVQFHLLNGRAAAIDERRAKIDLPTLGRVGRVAQCHSWLGILAS